MNQSQEQGASPWHAGERQLQESVGVAERMEVFGRKVVRDYLPEQHQLFYAQLPYLLVGAVDEQGLPPRNRINEYFAQEQITPKVVIEANSVSTLLEVIRHTAIATILPEPIATQDRALRKIPLLGDAPTRGAALLRRKNNYHSAASVAFMNLVLGGTESVVQ